jgi:protein gp37
LAAQGTSKYVRQETKDIEWALWSWNPITGCLHNCPYCYARDIANRFYGTFAPMIWPGRLTAPENMKYPQKSIDKAHAKGSYPGHARAIGLGNVFVCSMADLFGRWVPHEWIEKVLEIVHNSPEWNFLFLTKFPIRMADFDFPDNAWVGTTVDCQARVKNAEKAFKKIKAGVKWLSIEPLIEPLCFDALDAFQWIVLGGASESSQTPQWHPPQQWVNDITALARKSGVRVYWKENLLRRIREFPVELTFEYTDEAPPELQYLPRDQKTA